MKPITAKRILSFTGCKITTDLATIVAKSAFELNDYDLLEFIFGLMFLLKDPHNEYLAELKRISEEK